MRRSLCQACGDVGHRAVRTWLSLSTAFAPVVPTVATVAVIAAVAATVGGACAAAGGSRAPRGDRNVLTQEQMLATQHNNLYDVVEALRSNWLRTHGADSFATPTPVWVYFDDARLGGIESLRAVSPQSVTYVRYYDGLAATARWGVGHGQGVIFISSYPR